MNALQFFYSTKNLEWWQYISIWTWCTVNMCHGLLYGCPLYSWLAYFRYIHKFLRVDSALRYKLGQSSKSRNLSEWLSFWKLFHYENKAQNSENVKGDSLANSRTDKKWRPQDFSLFQNWWHPQATSFILFIAI